MSIEHYKSSNFEIRELQHNADIRLSVFGRVMLSDGKPLMYNGPLSLHTSLDIPINPGEPIKRAAGKFVALEMDRDTYVCSWDQAQYQFDETCTRELYTALHNLEMLMMTDVLFMSHCKLK
jgi:hypothetical protein